MRKPITLKVNDWKCQVTSEGEDLHIVILGLAYIYDSIKECGVKEARKQSNLMNDFNFEEIQK